MLAKPTQAEWEAACAEGFASNGATMSPDSIFGVRIANGDNRFPPLPADLHDYRYFCGGTEEDRRQADAEFLRGLYACVDRFEDLRRKAARRRCRVYHTAVQEAGRDYWNYRPERLVFGGTEHVG